MAVCMLSVVLMVSGTGWAAGLGRFTLASALGQPFEAEIELVAVKNEEKPGLIASLGSQQVFRQANIDYLPLLAAFRASIEVRPGGQPYVRIVSSQPVTEPLLNLLVELSWSSGRLVREYAVVLTPPGGGLAPTVQSAGNTPAGFEEDEPLSDKTQGTLGWERFGFPVPKGSKKEEALKQTVTGKIAPAASANRVLDGENEPQKDALQRAEGAEPWYSRREEGLSASVWGNGRDASSQPSLYAVEESAARKSGLHRGDGERSALLEKDIENYGLGFKQENPAPVEMQEQAVTFGPGKGVSPLVPIPRSMPSVLSVPAQGETDRLKGAKPIYEATDEPVAVAKSLQAALFSVNSTEPEAHPLDLANVARSIADQLTANFEVLGAVLAFLIAGILGASIVRRWKKAGYQTERNALSPPVESSDSLTLTGRAPSNVVRKGMQAAFSTDRIADSTGPRTRRRRGTRDAKTEPASPVSRNTPAEDVPIPTKVNVCALLSGSSEGAALPTQADMPTECRLAGADSNKTVSSAYPYTYLRGRPLRERRAGGRETLSQLDLARAYQEMGDKDAAVQVLREVIRDGDVGQQERARRILANLNP
jgi:FimV-like protein